MLVPTQSISNEQSEFDIFFVINYNLHMNKYQKLDYLANFASELNSDAIWHIVDSFTQKHINEVMPLLFACDLGRDFDQASGIADWYREHNFMTPSQRRWVILTIADRWHTMKSHKRMEIQVSL